MKEKTMVFGSFVVDLMARADHLPKPGETVKGSLFRQGPGGKGFNQAVAAHKSGADVIAVTKIGDDDFGKIAIETCKNINMDSSKIIISKEYQTGCAIINVGEDTGQNQIIIVPNACSKITKEEIQSLEPEIKKCKYILLQLEINQDANEYIVELAKKHSVKVILNTAPYQKISDEFLSKIDTVTPNEVEAMEMTSVEVKDMDSARKCADVFFKKGVKNVIITLGKNGVFVSDGKKDEIIKSYKVNAVDTTGAGDAFNGGFLTAISEGCDIFSSSRFANAVAALSVQKIGTTPSMPDRKEIDEFIKNNKLY